MLLLILVPVTVILVIGAFVIETSVRNVVVSITEKMAMEIAQSTADRVSEWLNGIVREMKLLAERNAVIEALKTGKWQDLIKMLKKEIKATPDLEMFFIAYPDGKSISTAGVSADISDRRYFKEIMKEGKDVVISDALMSKASGKPICIIAVPVKDESGKTIGLIGATILLTRLSDEIASKKAIGGMGAIESLILPV